MNTPFECIDPIVGRELWRLSDRNLDSRTRATLEAHLEACHACRLLSRLDAKTQALARAGRLQSQDPGAAVQASRLSGRILPRFNWTAALPLAASLVAVLALPPRPTTHGGQARGPDVVRFTRPVEGEIVSTREPELRWTPASQATGYSIELRDSDGRSVWAGETGVPRIRVPRAAALTPGREYRALLSVRPTDLAPPAPASVVFRSDSFGPVILHRLRWAHPLLQAAMLASLALLLLVWIAGARRRRPMRTS